MTRWNALGLFMLLAATIFAAALLASQTGWIDALTISAIFAGTVLWCVAGRILLFHRRQV